MSDRNAHSQQRMTKFSDPDWTARGQRRAVVPFTRLETLWFNTGSVCNIACSNCYLESTPRNDALAYLTRAEARAFLDEAGQMSPPPREVGFTGGEPFMNPDLLGMVEDALVGGYKVLLLTNAMKPMQRNAAALLALHRRFPRRIAVRVSLDHFLAAQHEAVRGKRTWRPALEGLAWLANNDFDVAVAGRMLWRETEESLRAGFAALFVELGLRIDAYDRSRLVLFPEMRNDNDVPEITDGCWQILDRRPDSVMCASSRMIVKRKGAPGPVVVSCTLLPYESAFELGPTLAAASRPVALNHRHCATFCVLGGASCTQGG